MVKKMKVDDLVAKLLKVDQDLEVVVDFDDGYYTLESVEVVNDGATVFLNLNSSNEA